MAAGDLCQVADVQAWLPSAPTATPAADLIAQLITAASRAICAYCGRAQFLPQDYAETYDGAGKTWMLLRQWPVLSVASITLRQAGVATVLSDPTSFSSKRRSPPEAPSA